MKSLLLMIAAKALPILALSFVVCLMLFKMYVYVRSRFGITVNCWFCNTNSCVPYADRNSWNCPECEQYNGFTRDGDYNRDILTEHDCSTRSDANSSMDSNNAGLCANAYYGNAMAGGQPPPNDNGLCAQCNEAQRLKVEKLAQFEPRSEARFDQELKRFKQELEQRYRLCTTCERHVNRVLHDKKKMVLGAKLLNFIMKGAALLKQPHYERLARAQKQRCLMRYKLWMKVMTMVNIVCLLCTLPTATSEQFNEMLGNKLAKPTYFVYTHALTMLHLTVAYASEWLAEQDFLSKLWMFAAIVGKLILYSVGTPQSQADELTFNSCYSSFYPYAMLVISFISNIVSGFKLSRYTALLVLWSIYAKGSVLISEAINGITFILLGSLFTLILLYMRDDSRLEEMSASESFHRLCTDECINDEETISMISEQLSCNGNNNNNNSNASQCGNLSVLSSNCRTPSPAPTQIPALTLKSNPAPQLRSASLNSLGKPLIAPSVLSMGSLRVSSQRTNFNPMSASPLPSPMPATSYSTNYLTQTSVYSTASVDQQDWRNNYAVGMNTHAGDGIWQRTNGINSNYQTSGRTTNGYDQRPMTRSTNNLLCPSHLILQQQRESNISAWVNATCIHSQPDLLDEPNTANLMLCNDNNIRDISCTSSQSSGFESQLGNQRLESQFGSVSGQDQSSLKNLNAGVGRDYTLPLRLQSPRVSSYAGQGVNEIRPGDLLRKWMERDGAAKTD
ncbi:uncharacterized protein LOC115565269 [Drosophila navojoa]|uniref:uncharacterized protein LOC115565269 n=1 Tax=Drosophila navojoa TaxID=7232 RepID=UPI0008473E83|nr:uncharacterized protein LOC115565269 [Drosophila navojoa]